MLKYFSTTDGEQGRELIAAPGQYYIRKRNENPARVLVVEACFCARFLDVLRRYNQLMLDNTQYRIARVGEEREDDAAIAELEEK